MADKKKITKRIGWQATVQNETAGPSSTLNLESLRVTAPEIWPGQNLCGKKKKKKKNEANWMVSNSAQLDRRTKQHTQFGVSASNGSRDMARTKLWRKKRKKRKKKKKIEKKMNEIIPYSVPYGDR